MRMKKLIFMFLAILLCGIVQAQTSEIILNNGKVVKGKIKSLSFNVDNTHEVRIKNEVSGENFDYTSADVKEIKFYGKKAKEVTNWIPLYAQMGLGMSYKKAPKLYKNPVFLHPVYKGKNISAYVHYIRTNTHVKSGSIYGFGLMFYYKSKDEDFARSYYLMDNSIAGIGEKTVLKMYFKGYPQIKEILKGLSMKEIRKDPTILVRKLDEVLE